MKYVMLTTAEGQMLPVIFPEALTHSVVADCMSLAVGICCNATGAPVSAGFVELGHDIEVHGDSESLKLASKPVDAARIMLGDAIAFMPDAMVLQIQEKLRTDKAAFDIRSAAVEIVDALHGYTFEFSSQPEQHKAEYDSAEYILKRYANAHSS